MVGRVHDPDTSAQNSAEPTKGDPMNEADRLTRLEDALTDLAVIVTEGNWGRLQAHMAPDVAAAGKRLQEFHRAVTKERSS